MEIYNQLKRPFDPKLISWRVGATNQEKTKGIALAYIDARDVMNRLDQVFGLNWQCRYSHAEGKTICEIGCLIDGTWIWRAGGAGDTDVEAEKGAISDAFKRAAVLFGVGRYLYELPNTWVSIKSQGRSYVLSDEPKMPYWATPEGFDKGVGKIEAVAHKPTQNPAFQPDEEEATYLLSVVDKVKACGTDYPMASDLLIAENLDNDEKTWVWDKLDSKIRSGIRKYNESLKQKEGV